MAKLIFLDPVVLGGFLSPIPTPSFPFDPDACLAFKNLMDRVGDVAIIIIANRSPSLEKMKEIWENHGLSGHKIIEIIGDRGGILCPTHSVHQWLRSNSFPFESFVIVDRMRREDSYPTRLVVVKDSLSNDHVEEILTILNQPFSKWDVKREYLPPVRARGDVCVCS